MEATAAVTTAKKRKREDDNLPRIQPSPNKRPKREGANNSTTGLSPEEGLKRTPRSFWDTLSRQFLTRRTLREFDRRTQVERAPSRPRKIKSLTVAAATLNRFASQGGPDLDDLRAYPEPAGRSRMAPKKKAERKRRNSSEGRSSTKRTASETGRSSAYDAAFEGKMIDNGFFPDGYDDDLEPENMDDIRSQLDKPRASLSPSKFDTEAFKDFRKANREAATEPEIMANVFPILAGSSARSGKQGVPFNNLLELAPDIQKEVRVDFYDGCAPTAVRKKVRDQLGQYISPSTTTTVPIVPNFFTEAKGPKGNPLVAKNQALHAGSIGARGMHKLRTFAGLDKSLDGNAYSITSTYSGGSGGGFLKLYTVHPTSSSDPSRQCDYHMTQLRGFDLTDNPDTFRKGASALRKARDWADTQRNELIPVANAKSDQSSSSSSSTTTATTGHTGLSQSTAVVNVDSDTSADELRDETHSDASEYKTPSVPNRGGAVRGK